MRSKSVLGLIFILLGGYTGATHAAEGGAEWLVAPYAWLSDVSVEQSDSDVGGGISASELLDKSDAVGMIRVEAAKNRWGVTVDYIFLGLSDTRFLGLPGPPPIGINIVGELDLTVFEIGGVYRPSGEDSGIQYLLGYRNISSDTTILITPTDSVTQRIDTDASLSDVFLGARYLHRLNKWDFAVRGDYSFGDSEGLLNLLASVGYRFNKVFALQGGYRHSVLEYEATSRQGDRTSTEIELSGPFLGFVFRF